MELQMLGTMMGMFLSMGLLILWLVLGFLRERRRFKLTMQDLERRERWMESDRKMILNHLLRRRGIGPEASDEEYVEAHGKLCREISQWYGFESAPSPTSH